MAELTFNLAHGLEIGGDLLKEVVLREPTTGDLLDAREQAEKPVYAPKPDGSGLTAELVVSSAKADVILLGLQIKRIGDVSGPFKVETLRKLHREDFALLLEKAEELDGATSPETRAAQEAMGQRGRDDADQRQPAPADPDSGDGDRVV